MWRKFKLNKDQTIHWISLDVFFELHAKQKFIIVDVREMDEFLEGHIPEAILVDHYNFTQFADSYDKDQPLLIYCRTQRRNKQAARRFAYKGFKHIYCLEGGVELWKQEGKEIVRRF